MRALLIGSFVFAGVALYVVNLAGWKESGMVGYLRNRTALMNNGGKSDEALRRERVTKLAQRAVDDLEQRLAVEKKKLEELDARLQESQSDAQDNSRDYASEYESEITRIHTEIDDIQQALRENHDRQAQAREQKRQLVAADAESERQNRAAFEENLQAQQEALQALQAKARELKARVGDVTVAWKLPRLLPQIEEKKAAINDLKEKRREFIDSHAAARVGSDAQLNGLRERKNR